MPFLIPVFVGAATAGAGAAAAAGGAITAGGLTSGLMMGAMGVGTVMQMQGTLQAGKDAEKIAKQRAAIDMANAEATDRAAEEEARIRGERGRRFIETQKSQAAAGNIRLNVGAPLVIEEETRQLIAQDIGYVLERGRAESDALRSSAALEIAQGKVLRKQSKSSALAQGLQGFGTMAFMGYQGGLFSKTSTPTPLLNQGVPKYYA